jgi:hypothetical protein
MTSATLGHQTFNTALQGGHAGVFQAFARPVNAPASLPAASPGASNPAGSAFNTESAPDGKPPSSSGASAGWSGTGNCALPGSVDGFQKAAPAPDLSVRAAHVGKAALLLLSVLLLRRFPGMPSRLHGTLLPADWKDWVKVGLGIAGLGQINQALHWKPPVWLNAMINVALVSPLVAGFRKQHFVQGLMLAPVVGGLVAASQYLSDKAEKPLQEKFNVSPVATHAVFSFLMVLSGLRMFPWVNNAIPKLQSTPEGAAMKTGMMMTCASGCCASLVCVNDIGQLGTALFRSVTNRKAKGNDTP